MKRSYVFGSMLAAALSVSLAAQSPTPPSGQGQTAPPAQGTSPAQPPTQGATRTQGMTSTQGTAGTAGTQGTAGSQIQQPVPGTQGQTPTANKPLTLTGCITSGTGTTPSYTLNNISGGSGTTASSYTLIGGDPAAMGTYGRSRVEVIGTLASPVGTGNAVGTTGRGTTSAAQTPGSPAAGSISTGAAGMSGGAGGGAAGAGGGAGSGATGASGSADTGAAGAATGGTGAAGSIGAAQTAGTTSPNFTVTSIRQIPGNCGGR